MSTKIKDVKGFYATKKTILPQQTDVVIRYTADYFGKSLSLEAMGIMIVVKYEDIEKIIKENK